MTWLAGGKVKSVLITDLFYSDFDIKKIALAQAEVNAILSAIDVQAFTTIVHRGFDALTSEQQAAIERGDSLIDARLGQASWTVDEANFLHVMICQFFFADERWREKVRSKWVETCLTYSSSDPVRPFPMASGAYAWLKD